MDKISRTRAAYSAVTIDLLARQVRVQEKIASCTASWRCATCPKGHVEIGLISRALDALEHFRP